MGRLLACEAAPAALKDTVKPATALLFLRASFLADEVSLLVCTLQVFGVAAGLTLLLNYTTTSRPPRSPQECSRTAYARQQQP